MGLSNSFSVKSIVLTNKSSLSNVYDGQKSDCLSNNVIYKPRNSQFACDGSVNNIGSIKCRPESEISKSVREIFNVLGIEAARQSIHNELTEVMDFSGIYINYHHTSLLCDRMTCSFNTKNIKYFSYIITLTTFKINKI